MFSDRKDTAGKEWESGDARGTKARRRMECFNAFKISIGMVILQFGLQIIDKLPNLEFALG